MNNKLLFLFLSVSFFSFSQSIERVEISGRIIANESDVENVTVFNTSSNNGVITTENGVFKIKVAINDVLEISALQFEKSTITITEDIVETKKLTVFVVERVNKLNEILILPYDLSGNLTVDIESVETFNPDLDAIYFGLANIDDYQFADDSQSAVENIAMPRPHIRYGMDFKIILGELFRTIFPKKPKSNSAKSPSENYYSPENKSLSDVYAHAFISQSFNIPEDKINAFLAYVEADDFDTNLLNEGKEVMLIEHLVQKSKEFLSQSGERD